MIVAKFPLTPFQQNTRVVACQKTKLAICIDPGERSDEMIDYIHDNGLTLQAITLTHGHLDHIGGTTDLKKSFPDAEILLHHDDEDLYYGLPQQPIMMGMPASQLAALGFAYDAPPKLTRNWKHGETYEVGEIRFSVRHCPGHTRGHVILAEETEKKAFVGDCLFQGSIGRNDLPGGDYDTLITSITEQIMTLDDETVVYSGHGPETTVGRERTSNPFLTGVYQPSRGRFL